MAFDGIRPVLHMPFAEQPGEPVVERELVALASRMIEAGVDGLVVLGLASEAWAVTDRERDVVVEAVTAACAGRVPLVVGVDGTTAVAADRVRRAAGQGAAGVMVLPPRGAVGSEGIVRHFATLADAAGVPLLMQDSPQVTGVTLDVATIVAATRAHPLVRALKVEIPGAGAKTSAARAEGVDIVAGWGGLGYLEQVERGAIGCMPGCDLGPALLAIDQLVRSGRRDMAWAAYRQILPLLAFETQSLDLLLLAAKRHLRRQGIFTSETLRAPGRALDEREAATIDALIDELSQLDVPGFGPGEAVA